MRFDSIGLWWEDAAPLKIPKAPKPKREPPEPVWLKPDYLPHFEAANACVFDYLTYKELRESALRRDEFTMDVESYKNYMLVGFRRIKDKKLILFEEIELAGKVVCKMDLAGLKWCMENLRFITFNGKMFDEPWVTLSLQGHDCKAMHGFTQRLIKKREEPDYTPPWMILKANKANQLKCDHIDLLEVAPGTMTSLKIYGGRFHCKTVQDLPFHHNAELSLEQIKVLRWYWNNDLDTTEGLYSELSEEMEVRVDLGKRYGMDLRSKSDAQIAEAIIGELCKKDLGIKKIPKAVVRPGSVFKYRAPPFIKFRSKMMKQVLKEICEAEFKVNALGYVISPEALDGPPPEKKSDKTGRVIKINNTTYRMGIGGLHSEDSHMHYVSGPAYQLHDWDVTGYYPNLMINTGLYPEALGPSFIIHFGNIKVEREEAKAAGRDKVAGTLKIVTNGTFGKTGSPYSIFYAPDLMIQTTVTGQLMLLMLIERLEWERIPVISGNTDGIVVACPTGRDADMRAIIKQWETDTNFNMEESKYKAIYSSDVNTYIAIYEKEKKGKWAKTKGRLAETGLMKNPTGQIVADAAVAKLVHGTPVEKTIKDCTDIRKFVHLRKVNNGGAVKDGEFLGGVVRWYISANESGEIIYAKTGNKVAKSDMGKPVMTLPDVLPDDINYDWYIQEANNVLKAVGYN